MRVIMKHPKRSSEIVRIDNKLKALQAAVDGPIEVFRVTADLAVICNEEGKLQHLPYNCTILGEQFVGTILVVGVDGEEFTDVPDVVIKNDMRFWRGCLR